jgi:hypothetical protein
MNFKIGDRVKFLDEIGEGIVKSISNGLVMVEDEHGFDIPYPPEALIKVVQLDIGEVDKRLAGESDQSENRSGHRETFRILEGKQPVMEVDLHLHEITDDEKGLTDHEKIEMQLTHFERSLQAAIDRRISRVIFIHGIGKGRLRDELRQRLRNKANCEFMDASYRTYGYGATEVRLWFN